jgi:hypothetical protein
MATMATMATGAVRPVFTNGERLTAQRLNEIVEYLRSSLRRTLLAPLSPGVAAGLELQGAATTPSTSGSQQISTMSAVLSANQTASVATVTVAPGVAIDGLARILVSQGTSFTYLDIAAQLPNLAAGDRVKVSLGASAGSASSAGDCAPTTGQSVTEGVALYFSLLPSTDQNALLSAVTPAPRAPPWSDPIDQSGSAASWAVPLGSVIYQQDTTLLPSLVERAGVMPSVGALRNSFDDVSLILDRAANGIPVLGVTVPTVFEPTAPAFFRTFAGGPLVQAAVVATDLGQPPAGRPNAATNTIFEAAGGNAGIPAPGGVPVAPGTSGVVAISMAYDTTISSSFPSVPHPGFPLVLSLAAQATPLVSPPIASGPSGTNLNYIGLSASASQLDPTGTLQLVPVATGGIVLAYVFLSAGTTSPLPVGTLLTPASGPLMSPITGQLQWGLVQATYGAVVVAQLATPVSNNAATGANVPALVWVVPPSNVVQSEIIISSLPLVQVAKKTP